MINYDRMHYSVKRVKKMTTTGIPTIRELINDFISDKDLSFDYNESKYSVKIYEANNKEAEILSINKISLIVNILDEDLFNKYFKIKAINKEMVEKALFEIINGLKDCDILINLKYSKVKDYFKEDKTNTSLKAKNNLNFFYRKFVLDESYLTEDININKSLVLNTDGIEEQYVINAFNVFRFTMNILEDNLLKIFFYKSCNYDRKFSLCLNYKNTKYTADYILKRFFKLNLEECGIEANDDNVFDEDIKNLYKMLVI